MAHGSSGRVLIPIRVPAVYNDGSFTTAVRDGKWERRPFRPGELHITANRKTLDDDVAVVVCTITNYLQNADKSLTEP
jgi:hypothetical protein